MLTSAFRQFTLTWLISFSTWNYIIVTLYFTSAFGVTLAYVLNPFIFKPKNPDFDDDTITIRKISQALYGSEADKIKPKSTPVPKYLQFHWALYNTAITSCVFLVILYWGLLHNYSQPLKFSLDTYLLIDRHGTILSLMLIDFALAKTPVRILHFIYPSVFALLYCIFTVSYWAITKEIIHDVLDYINRPLQAAGYLAAIVLVAVPILQGFMYLLYNLKLRCSR